MQNQQNMPGDCPNFRVAKMGLSPLSLTVPFVRAELVHTLQQRIAQIESNRRHSTAAPISSGCQPLDQLLPQHGFHRGTLVEYLNAGSGAGAATLAVIAAAQACAEGGLCVVLDPTGEFYPPAAARIGLALDQLIVVRPTDCADHDWAMDQALRCRAVAAVLAWPETTDVRSFRRWQLAVEEGRGLGLFLRPDAVRQTPSWADVRLLVKPLPTPEGLAGRRLKIQVLRCRGSADGGSIEVEIDDETHTVHPIARLAPAAAPRGAVGA